MNMLKEKGDEIRNDPIKLRMINDQLMQMERVLYYE